MGNTAPFEEMLQRWRAVGNTVPDLTGRDLNLKPPAPETNALLSTNWPVTKSFIKLTKVLICLNYEAQFGLSETSSLCSAFEEYFLQNLQFDYLLKKTVFKCCSDVDVVNYFYTLHALFCSFSRFCRIFVFENVKLNSKFQVLRTSSIYSNFL